MLPVEYHPGAGVPGAVRGSLAARRPRARRARRRRDRDGPRRARAAGRARVAGPGGTPVGILLRRWAQRVHGLDAAALQRSRSCAASASTRWRCDHVAARHDPSGVRLRRRLDRQGRHRRKSSPRALEAYDGPRFPADLAVLADRARCASLFGTREDVLIPSACLNSTVCGLVSRTVYTAGPRSAGQLPRGEDLRGARRRGPSARGSWTPSATSSTPRGSASPPAGRGRTPATAP